MSIRWCIGIFIIIDLYVSAGNKLFEVGAGV